MNKKIRVVLAEFIKKMQPGYMFRSRDIAKRIIEHNRRWDINPRTTSNLLKESELLRYNQKKEMWMRIEDPE